MRTPARALDEMRYESASVWLWQNSLWAALRTLSHASSVPVKEGKPASGSAIKASIFARNRARASRAGWWGIDLRPVLQQVLVNQGLDQGGPGDIPSALKAQPV